MAMFTMMFYVPVYFQVKGFDPRYVGLLLLPESIGGAVGSLGSGIIMRATGKYGILKIVFLAVFLAGPAGFLFSSVHDSILLPEINLSLNGLGFGGMVTVMLVCLLSAVPHEAQAIATAVQYAFHSSGATIGFSVSGMLLRLVLVSRLATKSPHRSIDRTIKDCHLRSQPSSQCPPEALEAYMDALRAVFLLALAFAMSGFACRFFTNNNRLPSRLDREDVSTLE
jgi:MFS family permease